MKDVNSSNFGLLIAYLVPGFIAIYGVRAVAPHVDVWLSADPHSATKVSDFLFGTIAALSAEMIINATRWHVVAPLLHACGVDRKPSDYPRIADEVPAYQYLIANQFRYYECYANSMVAIALSTSIWMATAEVFSVLAIVAFLLIQLVLWSASHKLQQANGCVRSAT